MSERIEVPRRGPLGPGRPGVLPPGPRNVPVVGATPTVDSDPLRRFEGLLRDHGDVTHYRVGSVLLFTLGHPDDIASVLVGEHQRWMKDEVTHEISRFVGRGLLTSEGSFWRRQRRIAAPTFQRRHIERFADTMVDCAVRWAATVEDGVRDVHHDMMGVTLDIVLRTLFGDADAPDHEEVGRIVETAMREFKHLHLTWRRLLPQWVFSGSAEQMHWARRELDRVLMGIIAARRRRKADGDDLLGRLLAARDEDGTGMNDAQVRDEVATMFLAGHETTALALCYAMMLLAAHPSEQARLREEIDGVLGGRVPTLADLPRLAYTDAVVREALRLYPPAYTIGREALRDCTVGGWVIPRGAQVLLPQWAVHRDARWFDEPQAFRPSRWLDGLAERLPRFAYFPFGGGPRVCVGNHFAMLEAVLCLAVCVQRFALRRDPSFVLSFSPSVTLRPNRGVSVELARRGPAPSSR